MRNMLLITLLASASSSAFAATINTDIALNVEDSTVGHQFNPSARSTIDYILGSGYGATAVPSFSANLSQINTFSLTISAPKGFEFQVRPAAGSQALILSFGEPLILWSASGWNGGLTDYVPTTVSFTGYEGSDWYNDTTGLSVDQEGRGLQLSGALYWSAYPEIKFSSVTISADLSVLDQRNYSEGLFSSVLGVLAIQNVLQIGTKIDPGAAVLLVPAAVPLPPSILLFMSSLLLPLMSSLKKRSALRGSLV